MKYDKNQPRRNAQRFFAQELRAYSMIHAVIENALPDLNKHKLLRINPHLCIDVYLASTADIEHEGIYRRELVDSYIRFNKNYLKKPLFSTSPSESDIDYYLNGRAVTWNERDTTRKNIARSHSSEAIKTAGKAIDKIMRPYTEPDIGFFIKGTNETTVNGQNPETYWLASPKLIEALESLFIKQVEPETTDEQ